jgi:hypothetical protein
MDASKPIFHVKQGTYYLVPESACLAKMDALAQKVCIIPASYPSLPVILQNRTR